MAKITYALMLIFSVEFAMYLFGGTSYDSTSLLGMVLDPASITTSPLYSTIIGILQGLALATIVVGVFININVYALYSAIAVVFLGFVPVLVNFYIFIGGALEEVLSASLVTMIQLVAVGPLIIFYIIACAEWIRGNQ